MEMLRANVRQLISREEISRKVEELGQRISSDFSGESLVVVGLLSGVFPFFADLVRSIDLDLQVCFMKVSSYGSEQVSSGTVNLALDIEAPIEGRRVLIVEDIVDTGQTLAKVLVHLQGYSPANISVCTLLDKPSRRNVKVPVDYIGFSIDDHYVVGYGMDADGSYRNLPYIGIFDPL